MLNRKYRLLIFRDDDSPLSRLSIRGWMILATVLLFAFSIAGVVRMWRYPELHAELLARKAIAEQALLRQQDILFELDTETKAIENGFRRVLDINPKLRVMLNLPPQLSRNSTGWDNGDPSPYKGLLAPSLYLKSMMRQKLKRLDDLYMDIRLEEVHQQELIHEVSIQKERLTRIPIIWPTRGRLASNFGYRISPFTGRKAFHKGLDVRAATGTPILAAANGEVTRAEWFSTYGNAVDIDHGDGIATRYAHMSKILVKQGDKVTRGQIIGLVGNTGRSVASHVHYEVQVNDKPVNPINYILR